MQLYCVDFKPSHVGERKCTTRLQMHEFIFHIQNYFFLSKAS